MVPAHPPLPTPASLPFHFSNGIHTSKRICDSLVGAITPATRQNGGSPVTAHCALIPGTVGVLIVTRRVSRRSKPSGTCIRWLNVLTNSPATTTSATDTAT